MQMERLKRLTFLFLSAFVTVVVNKIRRHDYVRGSISDILSIDTIYL